MISVLLSANLYLADASMRVSSGAIKLAELGLVVASLKYVLLVTTFKFVNDPIIVSAHTVCTHSLIGITNQNLVGSNLTSKHIVIWENVTP